MADLADSIVAPTDQPTLRECIDAYDNISFNADYIAALTSALGETNGGDVETLGNLIHKLSRESKECAQLLLSAARRVAQ